MKGLICCALGQSQRFMSFNEQLDYDIKQPMSNYTSTCYPLFHSCKRHYQKPFTIAKNQSSTMYHMKIINWKINILQKLLLKGRPCWLMEMWGFLH